MKCPHCNVVINFDPSAKNRFYWPDDENGDFEEQDGFGLEFQRCPNCDRLIVLYLTGRIDFEGEYYISDGCVKTSEVVFPRNSTRPVEKEVPERWKKDFSEASAVLSLSPKASAALSRRIVQDVLREHFNIHYPNLAREIDEFIGRADVPSYLKQALDAIRQVGNFAAHPLKDTNTGEIVEVEAGEAEWLLDVLEILFDYAFVQPIRLAEKQQQLNAKLQSMGKPPMNTKT